MRHRNIIAAVVVAAIAAVASQAIADKNEPSVTASATANASTNPAASASASASPLRKLDVAPPPDSESDVPTAAEWKKAEAVALARPLPKACKAVLLREWLRIRCHDPAPSAGMLLSGSRKGVFFYAWRPVSKAHGFTHFAAEDGFVEAVVQLRKGDRRLFQLTRSDVDSYEGGLFGQKGLLLVSETWLAGDDGPVVTVTPSGSPAGG